MSHPQVTACAEEAEPSVSLLEITTGIKSVIMNIGSNLDPIVPRTEDGPCVMSIAFEPIVHSQIPTHPRLFVVPAAIGATQGLATMTVLNANGLSSSLARPGKSNSWNNKKGRDGSVKIIPIISLAHVLKSIPYARL